MANHVSRTNIQITEPTNSLSMRKTTSEPVKSVTLKEEPSLYSKFKVSDASNKGDLSVLTKAQAENQAENQAYFDEMIKKIPINWDVSKTFKDIWEPSNRPDKNQGNNLPENGEEGEEQTGEVIDKAQIDCNEKFMAVVKRFGGGFSVEKIIERIDARLPARIKVKMVGNPPCPFLYITLYTRRDLGYDPSKELEMQSQWSKDSMEKGGLDRASWIVWMLGVKNLAQIEYTYTTPSVPNEEYWDYL